MEQFLHMDKRVLNIYFKYKHKGCGKTHTMMGDPSDEKEKGIIPRTFSHTVNIIETDK